MAGAAQDSLAPAVGLRAGQRAEQVSLTLLSSTPKTSRASTTWVLHTSRSPVLCGRRESFRKRWLGM